jgi:hypothetical protein
VSGRTTGAYRRSHSEKFRWSKGSRLSVSRAGGRITSTMFNLTQHMRSLSRDVPLETHLDGWNVIESQIALLSLIRARVDGLGPLYWQRNGTCLAHSESTSTSVSLSWLRGMLRDVFKH